MIVVFQIENELMMMPVEGKKAAKQTGAKKPASRPQRRSA
jgi:hypothetical protein